MNTVFVDIDTQFDFMDSRGNLYVPGAEDIIDNIKKLFDYAKEHKIKILSSIDAHTVDAERIFVYLAYVETREEIEDKYFGTGNEDIQVIEIPLVKAFEMIKNGEICDGKTIIGLFHLREELEKE